MTSTSALVVGGGIGGLAAAGALLRHGVDVRVHERAHQLSEIGAGVGLGVNAARLLERAGLGEAVDDAGAPLRGATLRNSDGSPVVAGRDTGGGAFRGVRGMHRADLVSVLLDAVPTDVVHIGRRCVAVEQTPDRARVRFEDGSVDEADLVVGADGIHSAVRPHVVDVTEPAFSGIVAYRGLVAADRVPDISVERVTTWLGAGRTFLVYPVRSGSLINFIGLVPADEQMSESWSAPGDPAALRAEFAGWDPQLGELLSRVEITYRWGLYDRSPLPRWTRGRATLLGDAAHPMLPFMGQGANQAIEDGAALAVLLDGLDGTDVPDALAAYEDLRRPRTSAIQERARANGTVFTVDPSDADGHAARAARMEHNMQSKPWVVDYDVEAEAATRAHPDAEGDADRPGTGVGQAVPRHPVSTSR